MIAEDLSAEERESFKVMLRKHPSLFISDYFEISGVTVVQHQINLKTQHEAGDAKITMPWEDPTRSFADQSEAVDSSRLHLSNGGFKMGVHGGSNPKQEWQVANLR